MKIILIGTSSSGKSSIMKALPRNYKKLSMDNLWEKMYCDKDIKPYEHLFKNKYYTQEEKSNIYKKYAWNYYKKETENSKNFVIDLFDSSDPSGLKKYLKNDVKNVLLYTDFKDLIKNIESRRNYEPRDLVVFDHFISLYTYTDDKNEAIDTIFLKDLINNFKKIKYLFSSEDMLIKTAENIFSLLMNTPIKNIKIDQKYFIKPRFEYDIILNSKNKTVNDLIKEFKDHK